MPPFYIPADEGDTREICVRVLEYVYMRAWQGIYETFGHLTYLLMVCNLFREIDAGNVIYFEKYLHLFREIDAGYVIYFEKYLHLFREINVGCQNVYT